MKKVLLGTTAIGAAALIAGPAAAQDGKISLGVGGYYQNFFTIVEQDYDLPNNDYQEFSVQHEGEIHFKGETTLDNGLTVGFQAQLEAITQGDQMDETFMYFEGSWGRLQLGSENSAPYLMQYAAPSAGLGVNTPNFAPYNAIGAMTNPSTYINYVSDANKITYFTPRFSGFQLGASYTPNIDAIGGNRQTGGLNTGEDASLGQVNPGSNAGYNNFFSVGANFVESFGGFDIAVAGGMEYGMEENSTPVSEDLVAYSGGLNVGFSGFTVGGSLLWANNGLDNDRDTFTWDLGATYGAGPWEVGVTYINAETETAAGDDDVQRVEVGGNYRLSPGVAVVGAVQYTTQDADSVNRDEDAWGVIVGTRLGF